MKGHGVFGLTGKRATCLGQGLGKGWERVVRVSLPRATYAKLRRGCCVLCDWGRYECAQAAITKSHRLSGLKNRNLLLTALKARSPRSSYLQIWFLLRPLSLVCRWLPSAVTSQGLVSGLTYPWTLSWNVSTSPLLIKASVSIGWALLYWPHLNLISPLKTLSLNTVTFWDTEAKTPAYEFRGGCNLFHNTYITIWILGSICLKIKGHLGFWYGLCRICT